MDCRHTVYCPKCKSETDFTYNTVLEENCVEIKVFCMECDYETSQTIYTQDMVDNS